MNDRPLGIGTDPDVAWHDGAIWCVWQEGAALHLVRLDAVTLEETWRATWSVGAPNVYAKLYAFDGRLWLGWREGTAPYRIVLRVVGTTHQEFLDDRGDGPDAGHGSHPFVFGGGDVAWQASGAPSWDVWRRALAGGTPRRIRSGVGTGLSRILGAEIRTVDEDRTALAGYTRPCWAAEDVVVAEGPQGGAYARVRDRELTLWPGQTANTPRCAMDGDRLVVVTWGSPWNVRVGVFAYGEMQPIGEAIVPLGRPAFIGSFYATTDKYQEAVTDYPQNCEVIVEASAVARATKPVIVSPDALAGVAHAQRVIGLYVAAEEEGTASALDVAAELARATWRQRFPSHPVPAVVGYVTRGMVARPTWPPRSVDVFAPECYFDLQSTPSAAGVEALISGWTHVLSATRPWLLVAQGYDRNGAMRDRMDALADVSPAYLEALRARPWILGLLWFAVNRPGGVRDYPVLLAAHRHIFAAVPSAPASLPVAAPPIPPPDPGEPSVMKITVPPDGYDKTGRVGQGAAIRFDLASDVPVTSVTVDFLGDGRNGLTVSSTDLRILGGVFLKPERPGNFQWQLTATNARGERDQTGASRAIAVQE